MPRAAFLGVLVMVVVSDWGSNEDLPFVLEFWVGWKAIPIHT
jgi:hypothetical protein